MKLFISYSHDTEEHSAWVAKLAGHLRSHGVDVIFDQWDLRLGDDLPFFMENGLSKSNMVLIICSLNYVEKANSGISGAGYEKRILSSDMIYGGNLDAKTGLDLLMTAKYFERIGDHAVNIAEWVEYSITGVHRNNEHQNN